MGSLVNCKPVSDGVYSVTAGAQVGGSATITFDIEPINDGYVLAAENFQYNHDAGNNSIIDNTPAITPTNTTSAYAAGNKVRFVIDLVDTYSTASSVEATIDFEGEATDVKLIPRTIAGTYDITESNTDQTAGSTAYSGSGFQGEQKLLFSKTFTRDSGYYFSSAPTATLSTGVAGNYDIQHFDFFDNTFENRLIARQFDVYYTFPAGSVTGDNIDFAASAVALPTPAVEITSWQMDTSSLPKMGGRRLLKIYGTSTAKFELAITRTSDSATYDFTTSTFTASSTKLDDITIGTDGVHSVDIFFPEEAASRTYNFKITAESGSAVSSSINNYNNANPNWTIENVGSDTVIALAHSTSNSVITSVTNATSNSLTGYAGLTGIDGFPAKKSTLTTTVNGSKAMVLRRQPVFSNTVAYNANTNTTVDEATMSDWTNTISGSNGGSIFDITDVSAAGSGSSTITITSSTDGYTVSEFGTTNVTSNLNLDNFINQAPVASNHTYNGTEDTVLTINLSGQASKPETQDTLAYSLVSSASIDPSVHGTLSAINSSTGICTFTPVANWNGSITFTWKCNDGYEDSNTATATITLAAVNDPPTAVTLRGTSSGGTVSVVENAGVNVGTLATTDVDPGTHTYTIVSGAGDTDNAKFTISGSTLRWAITPDYENPVDANTDNDYLVRIRSTDDGGQTVEGNFTVRVTNYAPTLYVSTRRLSCNDLCYGGGSSTEYTINASCSAVSNAGVERTNGAQVSLEDVFTGLSGLSGDTNWFALNIESTPANTRVTKVAHESYYKLIKVDASGEVTSIANCNSGSCVEV